MDIVLKNITKQFNGKVVLNQINLRMKQGNIYCIMGESGIGKTTIFQLLMGLIKPDSGEIEGMFHCRMSAVFQENRLCENLTPVVNISMVTDKSRNQIKEELLKLLPFDCLTKPVRELSGGMKRRTAIVRAMMADSELILMDEPLTGLDYDSKRKSIAYIKESQKERTLCIITHDIEEAKWFLEGKIQEEAVEASGKICLLHG